MNKIEILEKLRSEWNRLHDKINFKYGTQYPEDGDSEGWSDIGKKQGLALAINILEDGDDFD